jgi:hypothetical protein
MRVTDDVYLKELTEDYFHILETGNEEAFADLWHPEAVRFGYDEQSRALLALNKKDMLQLSVKGMKKMKEQLSGKEKVQLKLDEILRIQVIDGMLGLVELTWKLIIPWKKEKTHSFIHFAKDKGKWFIVHISEIVVERTE